MKKLLAAVLAVSLLALTGCERGLSEREKECYEMTGDSACVGKAYQQQPRSSGYGPVGPGTYQNHYGNPQHGYWDNGQYHFNNPNGQYASSTNAFLLGAGMGGLTAYLLTKNSNRSNWDQSNPGGYEKTVRTQKTYIGKGGKTISKAEFKKRKAQSQKDKAKNKAAKKKVANQKKRVADQKKRVAD